MTQQQGLKVAVALMAAQCVAAVLIHLGTFWWADVPFEAQLTGLVLFVGVNLLTLLPYWRAVPALNRRPWWTYFRHLPRGLQGIALLLLLLGLYALGLLIFDFNTRGLPPAAEHLALVRYTLIASGD
jgi:hypothetical protein